MAVVLSTPGGIAPKLRPENLPHPYAQECVGIDLRSGKFSPRGICVRRAPLQSAQPIKGFYRHGGKFYPLPESSESVSVQVVDGDGVATERTYITSPNTRLRARIGDGPDISEKLVGAPRPFVAEPDEYPESTTKNNIHSAYYRIASPLNEDPNQPPVPGGFAISILLPDGTESQLSAILPPHSAHKNRIVRAGDTIEINPPIIEDGASIRDEYDLDDAVYVFYRATAPGEFRQIGKDNSRFIMSIKENTSPVSPANNHSPLTITLTDNAVEPSAAYSVGAPKENLLAHEAGTTPRDGMRNIIAHPNRFLVAHLDHLICFSEVEQFGVWPRAYEVAVPEGKILNIAEHNGALWVFIEDAPPRAAAHTTESRYPCVSAGSVVNMGNLGILYAAKDGIVRVPGGELLTAAVIDRATPHDRWAPPDIAWAEGDEYCTPRFILTPRSPHGGFQLADQNREMRELGVRGKISTEGGTILLGKDGQLYDACGNGNGDFKFKSRRMFFADRSSPARVRLVAKGVRGGGETAFYNPRAYNLPVPDAITPAPERFRAANLYPPPADFAVPPVPRGQGTVTIRVSTGNEDGRIKTEEVVFTPDKPKGQRILGDIMDETQIDAQGTLKNRTVAAWMELEIEANDGREVSYVVIDDENGTLKIAPPQNILGEAIVPPVPPSE